MSGFAGFFTFPDPLPDAAQLLARLQRALPLPADPPDTLLLADGRAGLTATHLERSGDGQLAVAFDGTIHNRAALRAELEPAGSVPLRAISDGELILALYARDGAACVERLRGPFALALWDGRNRDGDGETCLLARDPMGLRVLYYFHDQPGGRLLFASGVRPLAASGVVPRQLDARGLYGFFRHGAVPEPFTMVAGVRALETGGRLAWQAGRLASDRFHAPPRFPAANDGDPDVAAAAVKSLRAALLESVDQCLADGRPTGIFLSGGVGSAALLALARETGREKNLRALTVGFDSVVPDEISLARRVAEHFGVPHTPLRLDRARARAWFDEFLAGLDQPGVHGFPWFALCRFAREEGINVALAGIGLGELLGHARLHEQLRIWMGWSRRLGSLRAAAGRVILATAARPARQRLADFLSRPPTLAGAYAASRGIHTAEEARAMVARFTDPTGCADPAPDDAPAGFSTLDDEINALELRRRLRDQHLRAADALGRAHGLELRLPFVDARVMEAFAEIPAARRVREGRRWVEEAVPEIPAWVGAYADSGLRFPLEEWQAGEWGAAKPADAAGRPRTRRTWEQKWSLFLFRRWWRQFAAG